MKTGLFINQKKAKCSIYESGVAISNILKTNPNFKLDYVETEPYFKTAREYDFYVVNWHHCTLAMSKLTLDRLRGLKIGVVLEVSNDSYTPYTPVGIFNAYIIIDPTKKRKNNLYPFPRPLEIVENLKEVISDKIVVGSFGFYGNKDKKFEEIIEHFNRTGEECIIRFNFPYADFIIDSKKIVDKYSDELKILSKPNIDLRITHDYLNKEELIRWCSEHTINIFPYYRKIPGLCAVTDQAISAGRAIAVTDCDTFRHLHKYISYYPKEDFNSLCKSSLTGVMQMQKDWHPDRFNDKFNEILTDNGVL